MATGSAVCPFCLALQKQVGSLTGTEVDPDQAEAASTVTGELEVEREVVAIGVKPDGEPIPGLGTIFGIRHRCKAAGSLLFLPVHGHGDPMIPPPGKGTPAAGSRAHVATYAASAPPPAEPVATEVQA